MERDDDRDPRDRSLLDARTFDRSDDANAFMPDPDDGDGGTHVDDDIAETLAEDFLQAATSGQDAGEERLDELVEEELGGPFITTSVAEEFAIGTDEMNPLDGMREALPRANAGMVQPSAEELGAAAEDEAEGADRDDEAGGPGDQPLRPDVDMDTGRRRR